MPYCAVHEEELQRSFPSELQNRAAKIEKFAKQHGFKLRFYKRGLCAIFQETAIPVEQSEMETETEAVINRELARSPARFLFTHSKQVAAIISGLSFLLVGLWFGISTRHTPQSRYPYYDTERPVPPWSEPMRLKGNLR